MTDFSNLLHYTRPAEGFTSSLVLGNGRLGASVFGGVKQDRICLNEDTLWSGYPFDDSEPDVSEYYRQIRDLVLVGKYAEAERIFEDRMARGPSANYLPLGDLLLDFAVEGEPTKYQRGLDLNSAVSYTRFSAGGIKYEREYFVSSPEDALVIRLSGSKSGSISFTARLASRLRSNCWVNGGVLYIEGECPGSMSAVAEDGSIRNAPVYFDDPEKRGIPFRGGLKIVTEGGSVSAEDGSDCLTVSGADSATLYFKAVSGFNGYDRSPFLEGKPYRELLDSELSGVESRSYESVKRAHGEDYGEFYSRVSLNLPGNKNSALPTDERLIAFEKNSTDRALYALLFNYGRYLMISGSRVGSQPMNLQGIWNDKFFAPWRSNYTVNINTQMNYWPAESTNLSELAQPLFKMVGELAEAGRNTARLLYGGKGFCVHHNTDIWRKTTPPGRGKRGICIYAFWPFAAGWLVRQLWEHYEYTPNEVFFQQLLYPVSRECCEFFLSMLIDTPDGLCFAANTSPEHILHIDGKEIATTLYSAMSNAIMRELFTNTAKCCDLAGDGDFAALLREKAARIAPYKIGSRGQLLEYDAEYEDRDSRNRHVSHLYGLYPGNEIDPDKTPELTDAARKALELRGDDGTGWSLGWKINFWARLRDGDRALKIVKLQLRPVTAERGPGGTYPNLLDAHPPFQIDGNFGACAGIAEMLLKSEVGSIRLLPALPSEWTDGSVSGLRAKGGITVNISWQGGALQSAELTADRDSELTLRCGKTEKNLRLTAGETVKIDDGFTD